MGLYDLHPDLADRQHILRIVGSDGFVASQGYNYNAASQTYTTNAWVNKAVRLLAENFAPVPIQVIREMTGKAIPHPVTELFSYVNETQSPADLWRQYLIHMMLGGENGLELVRGAAFGKYMEVWPRSPDQFNVIPDQANRRYYRVAGYKVFVDQNDKGFRVPPEEFIHNKFYNPLLPYRGIAPITALKNGILIDTLAQVWSLAFFKNSARPDYAVVAPLGTTKTEREEIEDKLSERFGGPGKAHKPIAIEDGVIDIKPLSFPPKDIEWLNQRQMARDEVAGVFGVPDELMGFGKDTYENFKTAMRAMVTLALVPMWRHRDADLTKHFRREGVLRPGEIIRSDLSDVPELQADRKEKIDMYVSLIRDAGEDPDTADAFLKLGLASVRQETAPASNAVRVLMPEPPRLAAPEPDYPEYGSPEHLARMQQIQTRITPHVRRFKRALSVALKRQAADVLEALERGDEFNSQDGAVTASLSDLFDLSAEVDKFKGSFRRLISAVFGDAAGQESTLYGLDELDLDSSEAIAAIEEVLGGFAAKTNNTTYKELMDLLTQAHSDHATLADAKKLVSDYFEERRSGPQLDRTARTTLTATNNAATDAVYFQDPTVKGSIWVAQFRNTRDAHAAAHGQRKNKNGYFGVGGEYLRYPGDPKGSAGNVINCQCGMVPDLGMKQEAIEWVAERISETAKP